eukprot:CAMPEP_0170511102 /NCGR_PEP_ID=MMETSP0208-20121228/66116_1 /TAXON_ID=197538 /ORGANISM="Strombidium inclinatum, Strain S3" /LENGTH=121 /DNA_ID=CAMNT_0010794607 /DNA_START=2203 /DNA_END=2568 /DNA_ORIENTATION=+
MSFHRPGTDALGFEQSADQDQGEQILVKEGGSKSPRIEGVRRKVQSAHLKTELVGGRLREVEQFVEGKGLLQLVQVELALLGDQILDFVDGKEAGVRPADLVAVFLIDGEAHAEDGNYFRQ